jgi:hypothetical protein
MLLISVLSAVLNEARAIRASDGDLCVPRTLSMLMAPPESPKLAE